MTSRPLHRPLALLPVALLLAGAGVRAADLPPHANLRILIVSDEVNPHGLPAAELTQPGDLSVALTDPASGLSVDAAPDGVLEIATDDLPLATAALSVGIGDPAAYDVLVYFAHRIPNGASGPSDQAAFVAAVEAFLQAGGGVVSFHHGSFAAAGKEAMLDLIGATATSIAWDTVTGQDVIDVAPGHFVTTQGVGYTGTKGYADPARGVPADDYAFFTNLPDERYPSFELDPAAGDVVLLFASDYVQGGSTHVLGFTHRQPGWQGVVVAYQPGEYQPNALDDLAGNNFQVLANAILFAAGAAPAPVPGPGPGTIVLAGVALAAAARRALRSPQVRGIPNARSFSGAPARSGGRGS